MPSSNASVVLVHGAWADGSSGAKVIAPLAASGVKAVAAPLPLTSFADDVAALDRALERVDPPVVLVGHAYAGAVIGATRSDRVKGLVYVAARPGRRRDGGGYVLSRESASAGAQARAGRARVDLSARGGLRRGVRAECFRGRTGGDGGGPRAISPACITVAGGRPLWKDRPAWFLVAEQDRMIVEENHRFMAERMKARIRSHPVDHTPLVTAPFTVLDIIREAIGEIARG
jgi:pimeloyl-ACP methyl ester carboxylesterase